MMYVFFLNQRHKLSKEPFVPSSHKNIQVNGVFGERTDHFMRRFPIQAPLNVGEYVAQCRHHLCLTLSLRMSH